MSLSTVCARRPSAQYQMYLRTRYHKRVGSQPSSAPSSNSLLGYPHYVSALLHAMPGGFAGFLATSLGGQRPFGVEGWRVVFLIVAAVSALVGSIVALLAADPRRKVRQNAELQEAYGIGIGLWLGLHCDIAGRAA